MDLGQTAMTLIMALVSQISILSCRIRINDGYLTMKKETLNKLGLEVVSIVFAVLLALGLSHWREESNKQASSDRSLTNILVEIHTNKLDLEDNFDMLEQRIDTLNDLLNKIENGMSQTGSLGFNMPVMSNSAWEAANATGAVESFELSMLMELSELYRFQEMFHNNGMDYFSQYSTIEFNKDENYKAAVKSNLAQVKTTLSLSKQLSSNYAEFYEEYYNTISPFMPDSLKARYGESK